MSWVNWEPCDEETAFAAWRRLTGNAPREFSDATFLSARSSALSFYSSHQLIEFNFASPSGAGLAFVLDGPDATRWLDGSSGPMHVTNEVESLALIDATVQDYLRFFLYFLRADGEAFVLIESPSDLLIGHDIGRVVPLTTRTIDENDRWIIDAAVVRESVLYATTFAVPPDGTVEMLDDEPIRELDDASVPAYPSLGVMRLPSDRELTEAIVSVLLEEAIAELDRNDVDSNTLLRHFNSTTGMVTPLDRLTALVVGSRPVIIIESDIPFVEESVAGLIDGPDRVVSVGAIGRASVVANDELRCEVAYEDSSIRLHLLSFHAFAGLFASERTANELALGDAAVLIGCDRATMVPEPLRRISDLTLTFPRIDRASFVRIFERVFQVRPAPGWDASGAAWTCDLVPADFHMPRRLSLDPEGALRFLRERAEARLRTITPDLGPNLKELHGLGEARQICEDLIADIRAAQAGEIPWSAVDKGLLMVGAPGTGKTTLARALARECGIKFVVSSASRWQSAGALDSHLRAMREDFAEARRYAPSILFLDEIDGIGSREALDDRNSVYQTDVINALLEQIQGIDTADPVIVIGATNYPEKVDPALRRAGRLDQVVELPLPNVAGLEQIFGHYLRPYRDADQIVADVEPRTLAELSLGLTGADVEFFVRGAFRRARRARRERINQADLVAEVTRRPRYPESSVRLGPREMKRVAVHEAGHAFARLTSATKGEDLTFVSIIPRLNGSLGFVATVPTDEHVETRRTLVERLETALAGRAAEEAVFGADDVSAGAGGASAASDLAVATQIAAFIVCKSGLGEDGAVRWTEAPTNDQNEQIDRMLSDAYRSIGAKLRDQRTLLDRIIGKLEENQEVSGRELRELVSQG